ncbi:MAG: FxDxF family PEP-CTERM protein [Pseudomonadota bacterium]
MNNTKSIFTAILLAGAAFTSSMATAAVDVSHAPSTISFLDGTRDYGASFGAGHAGATFADQYTFTLGGSNKLNTLVSSISDTAAVGLDITGFSLKDSSGLAFDGVRQLNGEIDLWKLNVSNLVSDTYTLTVFGTINSKFSGSYSGNINVTAVPEPETYAMLIAGLGLVGFMARRRKVVAAKA